MNPSTLVGLLASLLLLTVLLLFTAQQPSLLIDLPGLGVVLLGTFAATCISYPLAEIRRVPRLFGAVLRTEPDRTERDIDDLVNLARRRLDGDSRAVENALAQVHNPFVCHGVQLLVDQVAEEDILELMQWRIARLRAKERAEAQIFRTMASYAPAFGMLGTLVGLVNMVFVLGDGDLGSVGRQMALSLTTTLYGVLLANLLFKPVALKLERRTERRVVIMNMILQGISMMARKRSPGLMRETLKAFVAHYHDELQAEGARPARKPLSLAWRKRP
ncbi:chemotaxis protein MotA [Pantoea sp. Tr-811]|uniref:motility protein A n=1 Tax=unclassified Pantoea TaxID=2630326 RepID=UPI0014249413|nr:MULTISPECIES: MotA/TolQ/ExbB proton channel family protein [unclassified Pantoea]NIE76517.1 chemotaxis protein MotA [Pantoea sp. Ap-967]NIF26510.1 chemotaxis protein MotA [Pantoea sp. Tr-811]